VGSKDLVSSQNEVCHIVVEFMMIQSEFTILSKVTISLNASQGEISIETEPFEL